MWPPSFVQMSQAEEPGFIQTRIFFESLKKVEKAQAAPHASLASSR
jgi:hypothetical protein